MHSALDPESVSRYVGEMNSPAVSNDAMGRYDAIHISSLVFSSSSLWVVLYLLR